MKDLSIQGFTLLERIGAGGFGTVYRAHEEQFDRTVAVKVLDGSLDGDEEQRRFERERRATGALSRHPNIVTVHGAGLTSGGRPYIVMEYLANGSLAGRLADDGPLPWEDAVEFGVKLAGALETAHEAGILHRDVKPENVLLSDYGEPLLADFGIARIEGATATRSGVVTASLMHAPPEILSGDPPSVVSDVYSLASTVFALINGSAPFQRRGDEPLAALIARITTEEPPDLREQDVPDAMASSIESALAKEPRERPLSAADWGEMLRGAQEACAVSPTPLPLPALAGATTGAHNLGDGDTTERRRIGAAWLRRSSRTLRGALVVATVTAITASIAVAGNLVRNETPVANDLSTAREAPPDLGGIEVLADGATSTPTPSPSPSPSPSGSSPSPFLPPADDSGDSFDTITDEPPAPGGDSTPDGSGTSTPTEDSTPTSTTEPTQSPTTEPTQSPTASEPTDDSTQTNAAPTARYVTSVASGTNEVTFDASSSSDPDGDSLTYTWQFNDGTSAKAGKVVTHQFTIKDMASSGKYVVTLSVDDGQGGSDSVSAPASIKMPDVYGMNTDTAHQAIRGTGLGDPYYSPAWNDTTSYTSYLLWSQWPAADTTLTPSSRTRVVVWEEDSCIAFWETAEADDEWCYEPPPPSPTLDQGYF